MSLEAHPWEGELHHFTVTLVERDINGDTLILYSLITNKKSYQVIPQKRKIINIEDFLFIFNHYF